MDQIKSKRIIYILSFIAIIIACILVMTGCNGGTSDPSPTPAEPINPTAISAPQAGNILVGQSTDTSELTGEFSVDGNLHFTGAGYTLYYPGSVECGWEFVPKDLTTYNKLTGTVTVNVYKNKITFIENGGFEIEDVYFNDSYTIEKKILTAKNNYRFDGWTETNYSMNYIDFPVNFTQSKTLYAGYRFHTKDKLEYLQRDSTYTFVRANRENLTTSQIPSFNNPLTEPLEGSISGEVIIADMYDDNFVIGVHSFYGSGITNIIFNNYTTTLGGSVFAWCVNMDFTEFKIPSTVTSIEGNAFAGTNIKEIYVPNTVTNAREAFSDCYELKRVVFEDGNNSINLDWAFRRCSSLEIVELKRVEYLNKTFLECSMLEGVTIPSTVKEVDSYTFNSCTSLNEVKIEGDALQYIDDYSFSSCFKLKKIEFPPLTRISPLAFFLTPLEDIRITDEQIEWIAQSLHENYIGDATDFKVKITRGVQYGGLNFVAEYVSGMEEITLKFDNFSLQILNALVHEFFHHYQYVLLYGIGEETYDTVPVCNDKYFRYNATSNVTIIIIPNENVLFNEEDPDQGTLYEYYVECYKKEPNWKFILGTSYILLDEAHLQKWHTYIPLLPDNSNFDEYWNQTYESEARDFAYMFTGINYDQISG